MAEIAYSSTASKGPTVLRRGNGWEMFLPWRRTLLVGDSVESMLVYVWPWQTYLFSVSRSSCSGIAIFEDACLFAVVLLHAAKQSDVFGRRGCAARAPSAHPAGQQQSERACTKQPAPPAKFLRGTPTAAMGEIGRSSSIFSRGVPVPVPAPS